jgi:hypothetical protein
MASPTQREIVEGIRRELDVTGRERRFEVVRSSRQQNAIRLDLRPSIDGRKLDYTLEGGAASWHHTASPVVAVSVDEFAVYVQPTNDPYLELAKLLPYDLLVFSMPCSNVGWMTLLRLRASIGLRKRL